ncbi:unnamed protein product [Closterium sp. Yama58-4]|nr:unnamed protein product [Closterium sp. Yama58-4]
MLHGRGVASRRLPGAFTARSDFTAWREAHLTSPSSSSLPFHPQRQRRQSGGGAQGAADRDKKGATAMKQRRHEGQWRRSTMDGRSWLEKRNQGSMEEEHNGREVVAGGTKPRLVRSGVASRSGGVASRSDGVASRSDGVASRRDGVASRSDHVVQVFRCDARSWYSWYGFEGRWGGWVMGFPSQQPWSIPDSRRLHPYI